MTSDGGSTWTDIVGNRIPQAPIDDVIRHWQHPNWLLIATDVGVFRTTNLGTTWVKVGDNRPLVPINDIDVPDGSNTLPLVRPARQPTDLAERMRFDQLRHSGESTPGSP